MTMTEETTNSTGLFASIDPDEIPDEAPVNETEPTDENNAEPTPSVELRPAKRGECRVCGGPAKDGRSFYCNEHLEHAPGSTTRITSTSLAAPRRQNDPTRVNRRNLVKSYKNAILKANPQIVQASQFITGAPDEWMDNENVAAVQVGVNSDGSPRLVQLWKPTLRQQFEITERHAEALAEAAATFAESNQGKAVMTMASVAAPYVALGGALLMTGIHVIKLSNIKNQIVQLKGVIEQQRSGTQPQEQPQQTQPYDEYPQEGVA